MTTTNPFGAGPASPPTTGTRVLRRSRTQRVGAGVAGGLGEYFGLDPVLFRVLFATAAFFGGAGVLAYLLAWAAIPEAGTERAPIDRWIRELRHRRVPLWLVAGAAGLFLWIAAFSWWAPGPFLPVLVVVILLAAAVTRSSRRAASAVPPAPAMPAGPGSASGMGGTGADAVSLQKDAVDYTTTAMPPVPPVGTPGTPAGAPTWVQEARAWVDETKRARRERARRVLPVKVTTLVVLGATLLTLGVIDAVHGVALPVYFWAALIILVVGLLVGLALRRTPWSLTTLLAAAIVGLIAFGGSQARLHDGVGDRQWKPTSAPAAHYRLAFGRGLLDLRSLSPLTSARDVRIDVAAGEVEILAPKTLNLQIDANVHAGSIHVDNGYTETGGYNVNRIIDPPSTATGPRLTLRVHLADGHIAIIRS